MASTLVGLRDAPWAQKLRNNCAGRIRLVVAQVEAVFLLESHDLKPSVTTVEEGFELEHSLGYYDRALRKAGFST
jgi:hypothetical protein